jgi:hypothetical protein
MSFLKQKLGRYTGPAILCALVITALGVTTVVGAPKFITGKKVNKTINKKLRNNVNATEIRIAGSRVSDDTFSQEDASSVMASLPLSGGNYVVTTTYTMINSTAGVVVQCQLRAGAGRDSADTFGGTQQQGEAMSVTANVPSGSPVTLRCGDGTGGASGTLSNIEITAIRVPQITNLAG